MDQRKKLIRDLAVLMDEGQEITREVMRYEPWYPDSDRDMPLVAFDLDADWDIPNDLADRDSANSKAREEVCNKLRICCKNHRSFMDAYNEASQMSCGIHELKTASA